METDSSQKTKSSQTHVYAFIEGRIARYDGPRLHCAASTCSSSSAPKNKNCLRLVANTPQPRGAHFARKNWHNAAAKDHVTIQNGHCIFFVARARCLSAGLRYLRLTRLPRHDRGPVPGGNRSAASCLCTVLRRALNYYATRSPPKWPLHHNASPLRAQNSHRATTRDRATIQDGHRTTPQPDPKATSGCHKSKKFTNGWRPPELAVLN